MTNSTPLLSQDGQASMATMLLMSHHAFRRDIAQFWRALQRFAPGDAAKATALAEEWQGYRNALHGHHQMEDTAIFPSIASEQPALAEVIARLSADHRRIDPILERGDRAFAALGESVRAAAECVRELGAAAECVRELAAASAVVGELAALLEQHLVLEEASIVPTLRSAHGFPVPASDAEAAMYAAGFAWSSHGIAPEVLERVYAMLPQALTSKLPAARTAYAERCMRVWGSADAGASRTSIPDRLAHD